ncbi:MAG: hypothetical protein A2939_02605 [Parcubacteria group bacterium RIFCSPLOWO2_01_FULL_48_18]|nr:MAG: hypothetical protein A2939_02605 [Parcubacteria group bacterium RIFCSPLOWO2_01_FULL_48_18]OHB23671.1 MAG: hypothetical protein A3J67_06320 [Parcubacteria group bacterium RIFCSPHIGHO2_02_FULL_48_10b]
MNPLGVIFRVPLVRWLVVLLVVFLVFGGFLWYVNEYQPQQYLRRAYPAWYAFEQAVAGAREENYQYDPYGMLEASLGRIGEAAKRAAEEFFPLKPSKGDLKELHSKSLAVFQQYLASENTLEEEFASESEYYYSLLAELKNLFQSVSPDRALLANNPVSGGAQYEDVWQTYELLTENAGRILTKAEIARVPFRLKDFHDGLVRLLRESEQYAREGMGEFRRFKAFVSEGPYVTLAGKLGELKSLTQDQSSVALATNDPFVSSLENFKTAQSNITVSRILEDAIKQVGVIQQDAELTVAYFDFLSALNDFFVQFDDFNPPQLEFVNGHNTLAAVAVHRPSHASGWDDFGRMIRSLGWLVSMGKGVVPPSDLAGFHGRAIASLDDALSVGQQAYIEFSRFNNAITDARFRALQDDLFDLESLARRDLDFAEIWNLADISSAQANTAALLEAVSLGWEWALKKYNLVLQ